jgi:hypothetical protein
LIVALKNKSCVFASVLRDTICFGGQRGRTMREAA